jgi:hypothetical protein
MAPSTGTVVLNNILPAQRARRHRCRCRVRPRPDDQLQRTTTATATTCSRGHGPSSTRNSSPGRRRWHPGQQGCGRRFHLQPTSPAIDAGSAPVPALGITGSAVAGLAADEGIVDLGYHYGADEP